MANTDSPSRRANSGSFKAGESGNPAGRLKMPTEVRELLREHGPIALKRMIALSDSTDERISLYATKDILDRAYGKAKESVDITHNETADVMDEQQINNRILELLVKAREDRAAPPFGARAENSGLH